MTHAAGHVARQTRVPDSENIDQQTRAWMDAVDRRQLQVAQMDDLLSSATLAEVITAFNQLLAHHRTR